MFIVDQFRLKFDSVSTIYLKISKCTRLTENNKETLPNRKAHRFLLYISTGHVIY